MPHIPSTIEIQHACLQQGIHLPKERIQEIADLLIKYEGRHMDRPEEVKLSEADQVLDSLSDLRKYLEEIGYQSDTMDAATDEIVHEVEPLSSGGPGAKSAYRERYLFERLATIYSSCISRAEKLTEHSSGIKFIHAIFNLAEIDVKSRKLRFWAENRAADFEINAGIDISEFISHVRTR
jgi:hypothetical protein